MQDEYYEENTYSWDYLGFTSVWVLASFKELLKTHNFLSWRQMKNGWIEEKSPKTTKNIFFTSFHMYAAPES